MSLKYTCPGCGTPLGYDSLCWKCRAEQERKAVLAWTPEQIRAVDKPYTIFLYSGTIEEKQGGFPYDDADRS